MKPNAIVKHLRPLPAVIVLAAGLLAIKGSGLVLDARAAAAQADNAPAAQDGGAADTAAASGAPASDPAAEDAAGSASEVDVLTSLSHRRAELDARAQELDMRANLIAAAEKRVDGKISDLKALQSQIQTLIGERDEAQKKQMAVLVKVYSAMKPKDAARIFNSLDQPVLIDVAGQMKPDVLAAVMAQMNPQQAQDLTVKLAGQLKLPAKAEIPSAAQVASAAPVPPPAAPAAAAPQNAQQAPSQQAQQGTAGTAAPPPPAPAGG